MHLESCTRGHGASKSFRGQKSWVITHENGQKWPKSRILPMRLESCTRGDTTSKSSQDPKIVGYNPRKRPEMVEITNFADASRVVYQGSRGIEILLGPKIVGFNPRKRPEIAEISNCANASRVVSGVTGHRNRLGAKNRGL